MTRKLCDACRLEAAETRIAAEGPELSFELCLECAERVENLALRPLEWFRLASKVGPDVYLLHDDFYDESGMAYQARESVESPEAFPAPTLEEASQDASILVDFALCQWLLRPPVVEALMQHEMSTIQQLLAEVVKTRPSVYIEARTYEIAAEVLGPSAREWVRSRWSHQRPEVLFELAFASANCLPHDEGFQLVAEALGELPPDLTRELSASLAWFRSSDTLVWLEQNVSSPIMETWGRLAAVSELDWPTIVRWLERGRPLNLVALDALRSMYRYDTLLLKRMAPRLLDPPEREEFVTRLRAHRETDRVPRVRKAVESILDHAEQVLGAGVA